MRLRSIGLTVACPLKGLFCALLCTLKRGPYLVNCAIWTCAVDHGMAIRANRKQVSNWVNFILASGLR
jgi:hypothetical protein